MAFAAIRRISGPRRAGVIIASVALIIVMVLSVRTAAQPAQMGVRAEASGERVIITWVLPAGIAWEARVRPGDQLVSVAGAPATARDLAAVNIAPRIEVRAPSGAMLTASVAKALTDFAPVSAWSFPLVAACFVFIGILVFVLTTDSAVAWSIYGLTLSMAMTLLAARWTYVSALWALAIDYAGLLIFAASTFMLFLLFPVNRLPSLPGRAAAIISFAATITLLLCYPFIVARNPGAYGTLRQFSAALVAVEFLGACALIGTTALRKRSREDNRYALGLLALGMLGALVPFALLAMVPLFIGTQPPIAPEIAILSIVLLPFSLAIAILRGRFALIEQAARRGLITLVVWITLLGIYTMLFMSFVRLIDSRPIVMSGGQWLAPLWIALIALTFPFFQRGLRRWIERILFHDVYAYVDTLQDLSTTIARYTTVEDIAPYVLDQLGQKLALRWATLALHGDIMPLERYEWGDLPASQGTAPAGATFQETERDPPSDASRRLVELVAGGTVIGALTIGPKRYAGGFTSDDEAFISTVAPLVATALHNAVLIRRLQDQVAELAEREQALAALNTQLMQVQEEERQRIALDLHDDPVQRAMLLERELTEAAASPQVQRWRQAAEDIVASLRAVCAGLRPPVLDDLGLIVGIEWLVNDMRARTDVDVDLEVATTDRAPFGRLEAPLEIALYRVAQEALTNCRKHAYASHVVVRLQREQQYVLMQIADDGRGFDSSAAQQSSASHLGILGMHQRLRLWPSEITVERGVYGGTTVSVRVAVRKKSDDT